MIELEETYTIEQVAKRYHKTVTTVGRWVQAGRISAINTGTARNARYVFRREDLDGFDRRFLIHAKGEAESEN